MQERIDDVVPKITFSEAQIEDLKAIGLNQHGISRLLDHIEEYLFTAGRGLLVKEIPSIEAVKELDGLLPSLIDIQGKLEELSPHTLLCLRFISEQDEPLQNLKRETEEFIRLAMNIKKECRPAKRGRPSFSGRNRLASKAAKVAKATGIEVDCRSNGPFVKLLKIVFQAAGVRVSDMRGLAARCLKESAYLQTYYGLPY